MKKTITNAQFNKLYKENKDLIDKLVYRFRYVDDCRTIALMAFHHAAETFTPERGSFATYAWMAMKNEVLRSNRAFRSSMGAAEGMVRYAELIGKAKDDLKASGVIEPTEEELMDTSGIRSARTFRNALSVYNTLNVSSLDKTILDDVNYEERFRADDDFVCDLERNEVEAWVLERVESIPDWRDREILRGIMFDFSNDELCEATGWSEPTVIAHRRRLLGELKDEMLELGYAA